MPETWRRVVAALPALAAAGAALVWYWGEVRGRAPLREIPLGGCPGFAAQPALSPDGGRVAYACNGAGGDNFDIYVETIGGGEPLRLTRDAHRDLSPAWSPDGRQIAFLRVEGGGRATVRLVAASGGQERTLAAIDTPLPEDPGAPDLARLGPFLAFSHSGEFLLVHDRERPRGPYALFRLAVAGGEKRRLTNPRGLGDLEVAIAGDGRAVAFTRYLAPGRGNIYLADLAGGGEPRLLPTTVLWSFAPCWTLDGRDVLFAPTAIGEGGIFRIATFRSSRQRPVRREGNAALVWPTVAPGRLAYATVELRESLWEFADGRPRPLGQSGRSPAFSPGGHRIAFAAGGAIRTDDGVEAARAGPVGGGPRWSPDGRRIVFPSNPERYWDIFVAEVGKPARALTGRPGNHFAPAWSPDGRWIYFTSTRSGSDQIWRMTAEGAGLEPVTHGGGARGAVDAEGRHLYYIKTPVARALWRLPVAGGGEEKVLETEPFTEFALTGRGVYLAAGMPWPQREGRIRFFDFETCADREVLRTAGPLGRGLDVSPDGQRLVWSQVDLSSRLVLLEGFR